MAIATVGQARFKSGKPGSFTLIALRDISFDIITVREDGKALRRRTLGSFRKTRMQSTDVHYRGFVLPNYNSRSFLSALTRYACGFGLTHCSWFG